MARLPKEPEAGKIRYYLAMSRAKTITTTRCYVSTRGTFSPMLETVGAQDATSPEEAVTQHLMQCGSVVRTVRAEDVEGTPNAWVVIFDTETRAII